MELDKIEKLLEKYFEAETNLQEEQILSDYFSSENVAPHLEQYQPLFGFFKSEKQHVSNQDLLREKPVKSISWMSIAASFIVAFGLGFYFYNQEVKTKDLGTYDNPQEAFEATQKALALISKNVNKGMKSVEYIKEFETTTKVVFNQ